MSRSWKNGIYMYGIYGKYGKYGIYGKHPRRNKVKEWAIGSVKLASHGMRYGRVSQAIYAYHMTVHVIGKSVQPAGNLAGMSQAAQHTRSVRDTGVLMCVQNSHVWRINISKHMNERKRNETSFASWVEPSEWNE